MIEDVELFVPAYYDSFKVAETKLLPLGMTGKLLLLPYQISISIRQYLASASFGLYFRDCGINAHTTNVNLTI